MRVSCYLADLQYSLKYIVLALFIFTMQDSEASTTEISLLNKNITLEYEEEVRLSQILYDSYQKFDYEAYPLGITLIDDSKIEKIDNLKQEVFFSLLQVGSREAKNILQQLKLQSYVYFLPINNDPIDIRINKNIDPLVKGYYKLLMPERPKHITIIDPNMVNTVSINVKKNSDLRDYLAEISNTTQNASIWLIQPDRNIRMIKDISWGSNLYFLAPGATIFIELKDLSERDVNLNKKIALLLAHRLEF